MQVDSASPAQPSAGPAAPRQGAGALFAILLILALGLRLVDLGREDLWFDELWSLLNAEGRQADFLAVPLGHVLREPPRLTDPLSETSPAGLWRGMRLETHPPLYFIALHYWRALVGDGRFALRLLSALCSVLTIPFVAITVRRAAGSSAWLWATGLLAVSAADLQAAQSLRHYAPAGLFVAVTFWLVSRWTPARPAAAQSAPSSSSPVPSWRSWELWAYAAALWCAMMTHYMSALPLIGQAVYAMLAFRGAARRRWATSVLVAAGLFAAAWGPSLAAQWRNVRDSAEPVVSLDRQPLSTTPVQVLGAPIRLLFPIRELSVDLSILGLDRVRLLGDVRSDNPAIAGLGAILLLLMAWGGHRRPRAELLMFGLWFGMPLLLLALAEALSGRALIHHLRYPYFALPGLVGLLPLTLAGLRARPRKFVPVLLGLAALGMAAIGYPTRANPEATAAASFITEQLGADDLIVCDGFSAPPYWTRRLFLLLTHHADRPLQAIVLIRSAPDEASMAEISAFKRLFVLHGWDDMQHAPFPPQFDHGELVSRHFMGLGWFVMLERSGS